MMPSGNLPGTKSRPKLSMKIRFFQREKETNYERIVVEVGRAIKSNIRRKKETLIHHTLQRHSKPLSRINLVNDHLEKVYCIRLCPYPLSEQNNLPGYLPLGETMPTPHLSIRGSLYNAWRSNCFEKLRRIISQFFFR